MAKMIGHTTHVGAGGRHCTCCYDAPKYWAKMRRTAKRRERQSWKKELVR